MPLCLLTKGVQKGQGVAPGWLPPDHYVEVGIQLKKYALKDNYWGRKGGGVHQIREFHIF